MCSRKPRRKSLNKLNNTIYLDCHRFSHTWSPLLSLCWFYYELISNNLEFRVLNLLSLSKNFRLISVLIRDLKPKSIKFGFRSLMRALMSKYETLAATVHCLLNYFHFRQGFKYKVPTRVTTLLRRLFELNRFTIRPDDERYLYYQKFMCVMTFCSVCIIVYQVSIR